MGIVNGTTNFILSTMTQSGSDYESALAEAQGLGYAEADPSADVEGIDAAAKLVILSSLAFGTAMDGPNISTSGITAIRDGDIRFVAKMGYVVKLIAVAQRVGANGLARYVGPTLVPSTHPLAGINGAMNAVMVEGDKSGPLVWSGRGAGGEPTATAVLGDVIEAVRNTAAGRHDVPFSVDDSIELIATADVSSRFYLSLDVFDRPGVLAQVANVFGEFGISIQSMEQVGVGDEAQLFFITHEATTSAIDHTMTSLASLAAVGRVGCCLRLLATEESA
jgi:homoserine dehydrogenase